MILVYASVIVFLCSTPAFGQSDPTSLTLPKNIEILRPIRVALLEGEQAFEATFERSYQIETIQTGELLGRRRAESARIDAITNGVRIGGEPFKIYAVKLKSPSHRIQLGDRTYLDELQVIREADATLTVINEIDVEAYLRGVLPNEVPSRWPAEALKAQAVAARTYALFDELKEFDKDFSLRPTVRSQVYGGETDAVPSTNKAIQETSGEILMYEGHIFRAYFHASCGGHTYPADRVWDVQPHPSLTGVACAFCKKADAYFWKAKYTASELTEQLNAAGHAVGVLQELAPVNRDRWGRAEQMRIHHSHGSNLVSGNDFRLAIGSTRFRSMQVDVDRRAGNFHFSGRGYGHGVGLCQWGARQQAEEGKTYQEILAFYYPGAKVEKIY